MTQRASLLFLLFAVAAAPSLAEGPATDVLRVTAKPPVVTVTRSAPGRRFLSLPTLQYAFQVDAYCSGNDTPESLSINIADSRLSLSSAALEGDARQAIVVTVPARQIAPIALNGFCELEDTEQSAPGTGLGIAPVASEPDRMTVSAALSAQVSLLCFGSEAEPHMIYVSEPLDVTLSCEAPAEVAPERRNPPGPVRRLSFF